MTLAPPGGTYDTGTSVQLTAVAAAGYRFDHWTGDLTGSTNPASISMTANRSVTAVFIQTFTLTVQSSPVAGGSVTLVPPGGNYDEGTSVEVPAVAAAGYRFDHWTGDLTGPTNPASISMTADRSVTAVFIQTFTLTVQSSPVAGGSVTLAPPGGTYDTGTSVQLTAVAAAGYRFDHWTGDLTGSTNPASISMTANRSVTAVFIQTFTLTVQSFTGCRGFCDVGPSGRDL